MKRLQGKDTQIVIYEPTLKEEKFLDFNVVKDFDEFKKCLKSLLQIDTTHLLMLSKKRSIQEICCEEIRN